LLPQGASKLTALSKKLSVTPRGDLVIDAAPARWRSDEPEPTAHTPDW
jgi:hypothetical protein